MTRIAISPRFAIRIFEHRLEDHRVGHGRRRDSDRVPGRRALFQKRPNAFLSLGRRAPLVRWLRRRARRRRSPSAWPHSAIRCLAAADGAGRPGQQLRDVGGYSAVEVGLRHDGVHQAQCPGALGAEPGAGEEQLSRRRAPNLAEDERRNDRGDQAQAHFGEAERRVIGRHDDVADRGQAGTAAKRCALHASDDGHGQAIQRQEHARHVAGVVQVLLKREARHAAHPVEVGAGAKRLACAGEHDHAHAAVGRHRIGPPRELGDHAVVERVSDVGTVQREVLHAAVTTNIEIAESHALCGHILKTPYRGGGTGRCTRPTGPAPDCARVSSGSRIPSSHRRAVE